MENMLKHLVAAFAFLVQATAPGWADLHYTMHTEAHPVTSDVPLAQMGAMAGDVIIKTMLPEGFSDTVFWVSENGTRAELTNATAMMPAGTVMLRLADGRLIVMNPGAHTYWKLVVPGIPPQAVAALGQMKPAVSIVHTGEMMTIVGVQTERVAMTASTNLPIPAGAPLPPGVPFTITTKMDLWIADQYAVYAVSAAVRSPISTMLGFDLAGAPGFVMRSVSRNSMTPGVEIESVVTKIAEEPAPADAFEIPTDYKELPSPLSARPSFAGGVQRAAVAQPTLLPAGVYRPGNDVTVPKLIKSPYPQYTAEAMRAKIEGNVLLEGIVQPDGSISDLKVLRSLDSTYGLDYEAMKAASQWQFSPGLKDNQPVPVMVTIEVAFTLKK
jgi:TonB family protein